MEWYKLTVIIDFGELPCLYLHIFALSEETQWHNCWQKHISNWKQQQHKENNQQPRQPYLKPTALNFKYCWHWSIARALWQGDVFHFLCLYYYSLTVQHWCDDNHSETEFKCRRLDKSVFVTRSHKVGSNTWTCFLSAALLLSFFGQVFIHAPLGAGQCKTCAVHHHASQK